MAAIKLPFAQPQKGLALVAVLWIVAALSVMVTGVIRLTRDELHTVATQKQLVRADALGAGAINIVLQQMQTQPGAIKGLTVVPVQLEGVAMEVQVIPFSGFINLNSASPALLARLFTVAGGMSAQSAEQLAAVVVEQRQVRDSLGASVGFDAPEDLLQIPGVDYEVFARVAGLVVADRAGGVAGVNPLAAPIDVLTVLAGGNSALARQVASARGAQGAQADTSQLDATLLDRTLGNRFRLVARVPMNDGRWLLSSRGVDTGVVRDGLPWRVFSTDRRIEAPPPV